MVSMKEVKHYASVTCMILLAFVGTVAFRVSIPAVAYYTRDILESTALGVGLLTSAFFGARALSAIVSGRLCDKYISKVLYLSSLSFALNALVVNFYPYAQSLIHVVIIRLTQGLLNGIAWVPIQVVLGKSVPTSIRGRIYSIYFTLGSLGGMAGNAIYSLMVNEPLVKVIHVSSLFFSFSSLITLITAMLKRSSLHKDADIRTSLSSRKHVESVAVKVGLIGLVPILIIVLGSSLFNSVIRGDLIYIYMNEVVNLSKGVVAQYIAIAVLASLPMSYLLSWVSDKVSDVASLRLSMIMAFLGALVLVTPHKELVLIGLLLTYSGFSGIVPVARRVAISKFRLGGTALGIVNAVGNVGNVIGSALAGLIYDYLLSIHESAKLVILIMLIPLLAALLTSLLIKGKK